MYLARLRVRFHGLQSRTISQISTRDLGGLWNKDRPLQIDHTQEGWYDQQCEGCIVAVKGGKPQSQNIVPVRL